LAPNVAARKQADVGIGAINRGDTQNMLKKGPMIRANAEEEELYMNCTSCGCTQNNYLNLILINKPNT
jgi:hypothetical protein